MMPTYIAALLLCLTPYLSAYSTYQPQIELHLKTGNSRTIGQGSLLVPLWQANAQLLFAHLVGMADSKKSQEGNIALGYRRQRMQGIWGVYGYYDRRHSPFSHRFHQVTLGIEYLSPAFELRFNSYVPLGKRTYVLSYSSSYTSIDASYVETQTSHLKLEQSLGGFDAELGVQVLKPQLYLYGGYYHFAKTEYPILQGIKARVQGPLLPYLALQGEIQYDKVRKLHYFIGIQIKVPLGKQNKAINPWADKMTQMPLRDIDVIIELSDQSMEFDLQQATSITTYTDLDKIRQNLSGQFIVTQDIITSGRPHAPLGTEKTPFTGMIAGVSNNRETLQIRKIHGLTIVASSPYMGLFGYCRDAFIGYLSVHHTPFKIRGEQLAPGHKDTRLYLGGLVGFSYQNSILTHNINYSTIIGEGANIFLGGIIGMANNHTILKYNINQSAIIGKGKSAIVGGIAASIDQTSMTVHNLNIGSVSVYGQYSCAGGITGRTYKPNLFQFNINQGTVTGDGYYTTIGGIIGISAAQTNCVYNFNQGKIHGKNYKSCIGGIVGNQLSTIHILNNINQGLMLGEGDKICIGGILGNPSAVSLAQSTWNGTLNPTILIDTTSARGERKLSLAELQDINNFSETDGWLFGANEDWLMSLSGPILVWPIRKAALAMLKHLNALRALRIETWFPNELIVKLAKENLIYDAYLTQTYIDRIFHYAFTPALSSVDGGKARYLWTSYEFLSYVIDNNKNPILSEYALMDF